MNSECSICFEIITSVGPQKPLVTRCGHLFHDNCINSCLNNGIGKCPQCNQPIKSSYLIRLYVNEPENSGRTKDELIEQLKKQLQELNEKAQLQYDLIASLNRQIVLEKELSQREKRDDCTSTSTLQRGMVAPAKLNFPKKPNLGNSTGPIQGRNVSKSVIDRPVPQPFAFGSSSQTTSILFKTIPNNGFDRGNVDSSTAAEQNVFRFGSDGSNSTFNNFKFDAQSANPTTTNKPRMSPDELYTWFKNSQKIASQPTAGGETSTCSNVFATAVEPKSSLVEGKEKPPPLYDWSSSIFSVIRRTQDNVVQDAIVVDQLSNFASNSSDVV